MQISALVSLLPLLVALTSAAPYPVTDGDIVARAKGGADGGSTTEAASSNDATTSTTTGGTSGAGEEGAGKHSRKDECIIIEKSGAITFRVLSDTKDYKSEIEALSSKGIKITPPKSGHKKHEDSQSAAAKRAAGGEGQEGGQTSGSEQGKPHKHHHPWAHKVKGTMKAESDIAELSQATGLKCKKHDGKGKGEGKGEGKGHGGESSTSNSADSETATSGKQHGGSSTAGKESQ